MADFINIVTSIDSFDKPTLTQKRKNINFKDRSTYLSENYDIIFDLEYFFPDLFQETIIEYTKEFLEIAKEEYTLMDLIHELNYCDERLENTQFNPIPDPNSSLPYFYPEKMTPSQKSVTLYTKPYLHFAKFKNYSYLDDLIRYNPDYDPSYLEEQIKLIYLDHLKKYPNKQASVSFTSMIGWLRVNKYRTLNQALDDLKYEKTTKTSQSYKKPVIVDVDKQDIPPTSTNRGVVVHSTDYNL